MVLFQVVFLVWLSLFGPGRLEFLLLVDVFGTWMWNGPVMFDFLVGCLLLEVLISYRILGNDDLVMSILMFVVLGCNWLPG